MRYIFDIWEKLSADIKATEHILLVLDYDGTLTPIMDNPELAVLDEKTRDKVKTLTNHPFFTIGIISGRSLVDVKRKVGIDNIYYSGNHGLESEGPEMKFTSREAKELMPLIELVEEELVREIGHIKGVLVENKGLALSIHYRKVKEKEVSMVKDIFNRTLQPLIDEGKVKISFRNKVFEVCPPLELDKGNTLRWMIRNTSFAHSRFLPIYIGDDQEDDSAFEMVNKKKGISILVGKHSFNSCASYYLKSVKGVKVFLEKIKYTTDINKLNSK